MAKEKTSEIWKKIKFDFEFNNNNRYEISNLGRVRSFNYVSNGNVLRPNLTSGYNTLSLRFFNPRDEKTQAKFDASVQQKFKMMRKISLMKKNKESKASIKEAENLLKEFQANLSKKFKDDEKSRTVSHRILVHRLVAQYFLKKPKANQNLVGHIDHDKLNNKAENLMWMSQEECTAHQKKSPLVIKAKLARKEAGYSIITNAKLTVPKVMQLKKLLNEGKPMQKLVKQFKITHTQILRIKRGINWGHIEAAK